MSSSFERISIATRKASYLVRRRLLSCYKLSLPLLIMDILDVLSKVRVNNSITEKEFHNHVPFGSPKYANNDEIRIVIPEIDKYTLPSESELLIEGRLRLADDKISATASLIHNAAAFMFSSIRYVLSGVEIDEVRNVGISSTMKGYFSYSPSHVHKLENAGWDFGTAKAPVLDSKGNFSICIPLRMLMGLMEDFRSILMNVSQELILKRCSDDTDVIFNTVTTEQVKLLIDNIVWRVPHVKVGLAQDLALTKLASKNTLMEIFFRGWEIHENPGIPESTKHNWSIKTAPHLETPRYIIIGFQTDKKGKVDQNMSRFDAINLNDVTLYLNGKRYPYESIPMDFTNNRLAVAYNTYAHFQSVYYGYEHGEPLMKLSQFKLCPLVGIDCSHQDDIVHRSGVEVRIEFTTIENIPKNTTAYCLIMHNKQYEYSPFNKVVQRKY